MIKRLEKTVQGAASSLYNDQVKGDETAGTCSMHGREEKCIQGTGMKTTGKEPTRKT
jgi:hypothetical protein